MNTRFSVTDLTPDLYKAQLGVSMAIGKSALPTGLRHLVDLRVSQINGCSFCINMHTGEALHGGDTRERLAALSGWSASPLFTPDEKAALAWAEGLTHIDAGRLDGLLEELRRHFSEQQISALTVAVATINAWNRIAISQHRDVPAAVAA